MKVNSPAPSTAAQGEPLPPTTAMNSNSNPSPMLNGEGFTKRSNSAYSQPATLASSAA